MKKLIYTFLFLFLLFLTAVIFFTKKDLISTYLGGGKKAKSEPGLAWKTKGISLKFGPVVAFDGNIYAGKENTFYCFSNSGALLWEYTSGDLFEATPVIGKDSGIYSFAPNSIVRFSKDGKMLWRIDAPFGEQYGPDPLVTDSGIIVTRQLGAQRKVTFKDFRLVLIEPKGFETELAAFGDKIKPSGIKPLMIVGTKDTNLILEHDRQVILSTPHGKILWEMEVQEKPIHFALDSTKEIILVSSKDELRAYKIGGEKLWERIFAGREIDEIKIRDTAEFLININNTELIAMTVKEGRETWKYNPNIYIDKLVSVFESNLVINKNKDIFLFFNNGKMLKLQKGGEVKGPWEVNEMKFKPLYSISNDGFIYILDEENNLCAIRTAI